MGEGLGALVLEEYESPKQEELKYMLR